jgi:hypothetical protein
MIDLEVDDTIEDIRFDFETAKKNLPTFTSLKLCEMIICERYLGFPKGISEHCMIELAFRRQNGDQFDFEEKLIELTKDLVPIETSIPDIHGLFNNFSKIGKI